ncbi:peptidoglycan-binding protein [bacterium]|nr:peptidoglycan-binding protein [bacterium]
MKISLPKTDLLSFENLKKIKRLPFVLNFKEKILLSFFCFLFLLGIILLIFSFYLSHTEVVPARWGSIKEGIVGQPRFINPIYADTNDPDRDLVELIFSGLMKYDTHGKIVLDAAKSYQVLEEGRVYEVELKKNIYFHDGTPLTADDVIFTIKTIQNPSFKSPLLKRWLGVEVEKISDYKIRFVLQNPYPEFLENLTVKILPAHIWKNISPENFPLAIYNLKPIGSGPFKFESLQQDSSGSINSITLSAFENYFGKKPFIQKITFLFFENQQSLVSAANSGLIDSFVLPLAFQDSPSNLKLYTFKSPRYFALFINLGKNKNLDTPEIRSALNYIIDRKKIIDEVFNQKGLEEISPFLPEIFDIEKPEINTPDLEKAKALLNKNGFQLIDGKWVKVEKEVKMKFTKDLTVGSKGKEVENLQKCLAKFPEIYPEGEITGYFGKKTKAAVIRLQEKYFEEILKPSGLTQGNGRVGPATREKLNEICVVSPAQNIPLKVNIVTGDETVLTALGNAVKNQLENFGIETTLKVLPLNKLKQDIIQKRNYDILLFGQVLGLLPDPFAFWHSSQREYPGLNFSNYKNKNLDKLLEKIRVEPDINKKKELISEAQEIFLEDMPAIILGSPDFIYYASPKIKGIEEGVIITPSQRFNQISNWYIKTKRAFKK